MMVVHKALYEWHVFRPKLASTVWRLLAHVDWFRVASTRNPQTRCLLKPSRCGRSRPSSLRRSGVTPAYWSGHRAWPAQKDYVRYSPALLKAHLTASVPA